MKPRVLINCSNLHNGGGVAVATSVIDCLSKMDHLGLEISVLLSTPVERNLRGLKTDLKPFQSCEVFDVHGISALWQGLDNKFQNYDLVFTVFGPAYFARRNTYHLFGFAQPNIVYPFNMLSARMSFLKRWRLRIKFEIQALFFSRADELVVELEHVKEGIIQRSFFRNKPVHVVYSSVHSVFSNPSHWAPLDLPKQQGRLRLGVISRNYPHKNLNILPDVKQHLLQKYGREVDIYVTFPTEEWAACDERFRRNIINVGELSLGQCPTFYEALDGVVFPSLLECFSAVPIETMMVKRPLFASNLPFIRDICGNMSHYFDPLDAADIARVINDYFNLPVTERQRHCEAAYTHVQRYPGPDERAASYLNVIHQALA